MGTYPKHRKPVGQTKCPYCDKSFNARGLGTHIREAHKTVVKTIVKTVVNNKSNAVIDFSNSKSNVVTDLSNKNITTVASEITGKDLSECKRPDGKHFYTEQDICILLSYIIRHTYNPGSEVALFNQFTLMDLIADFERRFECRFSDVKKVNQHIQIGKTLEEHWRFAEKYMNLKYSR
jgi:hypothetical protein